MYYMYQVKHLGVGNQLSVSIQTPLGVGNQLSVSSQTPLGEVIDRLNKSNTSGVGIYLSVLTQTPLGVYIYLS